VVLGVRHAGLEDRLRGRFPRSGWESGGRGGNGGNGTETWVRIRGSGERDAEGRLIEGCAWDEIGTVWCVCGCRVRK